MTMIARAIKILWYRHLTRDHSMRAEEFRRAVSWDLQAVTYHQTLADETRDKLRVLEFDHER